MKEGIEREELDYLIKKLNFDREGGSAGKALSLTKSMMP